MNLPKKHHEFAHTCNFVLRESGISCRCTIYAAADLIYMPKIVFGKVNKLTKNRMLLFMGSLIRISNVCPCDSVAIYGMVMSLNNRHICTQYGLGWSGGAMVLGKVSVPGHPTTLDSSRARA